jgi:1-acyl-sn-glycerol-3-phosphate acyltransferase
MSDLSAEPSRFARRARFLRPVARYHRFEMRGLEHVPKQGSALLVGTHSSITYDMFLAAITVFDHTGRVPRSIGDRVWFHNPTLGQLVRDLGIVDTNFDGAVELLKAGEILAVAPGGMREALRPSREGDMPDWRGRHGFVRLWLATGAPLILGHCPAARSVVTVYDNPISRLVYRSFRMPLPIWRGLGPTLFPRPTKLVYHLSPPILPPNEPVTEDLVIAVHADLEARMQAFVIEKRSCP